MSARKYDNYRRGLARIVESHGATLDDVLTPNYASDKDRFIAWMAESLAAGFRQLEEFDEPHVAMRCLCQAKEYKGRLGGFVGYAIVDDAMCVLQCELERALRGDR